MLPKAMFSFMGCVKAQFDLNLRRDPEQYRNFTVIAARIECTARRAKADGEPGP
jgi:hypothetical protein